MSAARVFEARPAVRERVPLIVGIVGPSGSGKTYSALRVATGMGGRVFLIDTEARRALWYADAFSFEHVPFGEPFSPADYEAAIKFCIAKGAETIVIDSMSHEHEGMGGVLEMHAAEQQRIAKAWGVPQDKANMAAWQLPKSLRRSLLNTMIQSGKNFVLCFRAKEKLDLRGPKPKPMGWMPIAGEEFVYETTVNCLLYPGAGGVPSWQPDEMGEKAIIKLPGHLRSVFEGGGPLSEEVGKRLAAWAAGGAAPPAARPGAAPPTTPEQVKEIQDELGRLKWTTKQIKEWCAGFGGTWPNNIPADRAVAAVQDLLTRS